VSADDGPPVLRPGTRRPSGEWERLSIACAIPWRPVQTILPIRIAQAATPCAGVVRGLRIHRPLGRVAAILRAAGRTCATLRDGRQAGRHA